MTVGKFFEWYAEHHSKTTLGEIEDKIKSMPTSERRNLKSILNIMLVDCED